ncbi:SRPBCC family protein [Bradyrhizobium sp. 2TAF24]|uniref:SRPBCC family protein n=1 Tax=Bradyrhizobium sp. 2TAF24 TaxID=3233011 RepID=UPI003F8F4528
MSVNLSQTPQTGEDFTISRTFDAPRAVVWRARAEVERMVQWWGPEGCKLHVESLDFRPGGLFVYAMDFDQGARMWGRFVYHDIVAPERLVYTHGFSNAQGQAARSPFSENWPLEIHNVLTLTEQDGRTRLDLRSRPIDPTDAERETFRTMRGSMTEGSNGIFDRLAAYLAHD